MFGVLRAFAGAKQLQPQSHVSRGYPGTHGPPPTPAELRTEIEVEKTTKWITIVDF